MVDGGRVGGFEDGEAQGVWVFDGGDGLFVEKVV